MSASQARLHSPKRQTRPDSTLTGKRLIQCQAFESAREIRDLSEVEDDVES